MGSVNPDAGFGKQRQRLRHTFLTASFTLASASAERAPSPVAGLNLRGLTWTRSSFKVPANLGEVLS